MLLDPEYSIEYRFYINNIILHLSSTRDSIILFVRSNLLSNSLFGVVVCDTLHNELSYPIQHFPVSPRHSDNQNIRP